MPSAKCIHWRKPPRSGAPGVGALVVGLEPSGEVGHLPSGVPGIAPSGATGGLEVEPCQCGAEHQGGRSLLARSRRQMGVHLDALEKQLHTSGGPWILGAHFSLADVSWLVIFERLAQVDCLHLFVGDGRLPLLVGVVPRLWIQGGRAGPVPFSALAVAGCAAHLVNLLSLGGRSSTFLLPAAGKGTDPGQEPDGQANRAERAETHRQPRESRWAKNMGALDR